MTVELKLTNYSPQEQELGVAVNRRTAVLQGQGDYDTIVYRDPGATIEVSITNDSLLQEFLGTVKGATLGIEPPLERAKAVTRTVLNETPMIDNKDILHNREIQVLLGDSLAFGVECVDRALAIEAVLKMTNVTKEAKMLVGVDYKNGRHLSNHADVEFSLEDDNYVAVTMGERAGEVMTEEKYISQYLPERERKGLGKRTIRKSWGWPYFEAI